MNTVQLLDTIKNIALSQNTCNSAFDGDVYDNWNSGEVKFGSVNAAINEIASEDQLFTYSVYLYYGDRLLQDKSNANQIVTDGVNTIQSIINILNNEDGIDVTGTIAFTPFEQKFADYLAGVYCQIYVTTDSPLGSCEMDSYSYTDSKDAIIAELTQELTEARDELRIVKAELADAEADLAAARREIEELEADVNAKEAEITRLEGVIGELETEVSSLTAQVTTLTHQIEVDEAEISRLEGIISDKNETIATLQSQVTSLTQQIQTKNERIAELEASIATLTTKSIDGNGEYTPPSGTLGWDKVIVEVPSDAKPEYKLTTSITANDTYTYLPTSGNVFNEVEIDVNVPSKTEEHLTTSLTRNDTYNFTPTADSVFSGATITVAVPIPTITLEDIEVTSNGVYEHGQGYDGLGKVKVDVPNPPLQTKGVTVNGTVTADTGYYGLDKVIVNIPSDRKPEQQLTQTISSNTTTSFTPDTGYVFSGVTITTNVQPPLENVTATTNGVVTASTGYYGLGEVNVQVSSKPEDNLTATLTTNNLTTSFTPQVGHVFSGATITVNVDDYYDEFTAATQQLSSVTAQLTAVTDEYENFTADTAQNVTAAYNSCNTMGATIPAQQTLANLPSTILTIPKGLDMNNITGLDITNATGTIDLSRINNSNNLVNLKIKTTDVTGVDGLSTLNTSSLKWLWLGYSSDSIDLSGYSFPSAFSNQIRPASSDIPWYVLTRWTQPVLSFSCIDEFDLTKTICKHKEIYANNISIGTNGKTYSMAYAFCNPGPSAPVTTTISATGTTMSRVDDLSMAFEGQNALTTLRLNNTGKVKYWFRTFYGVKFTDNPQVRSTIESLNTSYANDMEFMLGYYYNGQSVESGTTYNLDLRSWDFHPISAKSLFYGRSKLNKLNIAGWRGDTLSTGALKNAFYNCTSLTSLVGDLSINSVISDNIKVFDGLYHSTDLSSLSGNDLTNVNRASLRAIINGLEDMTYENTPTLKLGNALNTLTSADITVAINKNWDITN